MANERYVFKLFISGMSVKSVRALENFNALVANYMNGQCDVEIIDISKDRKLAVEHQIFAVPALLKVGPPRRMIVGDLSDAEKIIKLLDLDIAKNENGIRNSTGHD